MTIPAVIIIAIAGNTALETGTLDGGPSDAGLDPAYFDAYLRGGRTNVLQGAVHLGLFLAYLLLIFIP
jgi:Ca2+/H+ antiporter